MTDLIGRDIGDAIRRLIAAAEKSESAVTAEAARATGGLPVHVDMGGALVVTPKGDVVQYDFETRATSVPDNKWRTLALSKAARRFSELKDLAPSRPSNAITCPDCGGSGSIHGTDCFECLGTGWIERVN